VVPALRANRQPRTFPAVLPAAQRAVVRYLWEKTDGLDQHRAALSRLAAEVTYLGHSHTVVRVALVDGDSTPDRWDYAWMDANPVALRTPYVGRLAHLVECYDRAARPNPSLALQNSSPPGQVRPHTLFDPEAVIVLADNGGFVPAVDAFPLVAKRFRDAHGPAPD
jgi:CRISPR-associated protein Csb2